MYKLLLFHNSVLFYMCLFSIGFVSGQVQQQVLNKLVCIEHEECGACLSAASHCRWCADPYFKSPAPRCDDEESLVAAQCGQSAIQRPDPSIWEVLEDQPLQDVPAGSSGMDTVVQIRPQQLHLSLKPRETRKIKFTYRPARNYPLDLYYLMDLTYSMKDDKETLVSLRNDLPAMLQNLTANFKIGFGSFAEKPLMPFINTDSKRLKNPCGMDDYVCLPTYSYKHHLSLTNKVEEFISSVNSSSVTANLDNAEAQLEALVQAVTCGARVGWSEHSRKIVLVLTDGLMHTAGDGRLAGATLRNDEQCHLDEDGYYADSRIYDYPSIAQVYRLLDEFKVNVIFAITEEVKSHYDSLHQLLVDYTYVAKLESDSSNILKVVKTGYEDIVSVVNFEDDSREGPVKVKYFTDCGQGGPMVEATKCSGVEFGMTLNYEAHVTLDACPRFEKSTQTIKISESQLGQDSITLVVDLQCGCDCETESASNSTMSITCGPNKHLVCGVCSCNEGWSGPDCDCSTKDEAASAALEAQCREPTAGSTRGLLCSGAGDCLCGRCECDPGFNGRFCQCGTCEVALDNGLECGGVGRGVCACGQCACEDGWAGAACDCPAASDACVAPGAKDVCSGHGDCVCGRCQCSTADYDGSKYTGVYCETCATCENPMCATAEPCVSCHLNSSCTELCNIGAYNYTVSERMQDPDIDTDDISCIFRHEENGLDCEYKYTYTTGTKSMVAMEIVLRSKECFQPTSARLMTSGFVIIACILLAGIIVIMFVKISQVVADRRAYAKFVQEAQESRKNMQELNPLYISPISEFRLPEAYPRDKND